MLLVQNGEKKMVVPCWTNPAVQKKKRIELVLPAKWEERDKKNNIMKEIGV